MAWLAASVRKKLSASGKPGFVDFPFISQEISFSPRFSSTVYWPYHPPKKILELAGVFSLDHDRYPTEPLRLARRQQPFDGYSRRYAPFPSSAHSFAFAPGEPPSACQRIRAPSVLRTTALRWPSPSNHPSGLPVIVCRSN